MTRPRPGTLPSTSPEGRFSHGLVQFARLQGNTFYEVRSGCSRHKRCLGKSFRPRGWWTLRRQVLPWFGGEKGNSATRHPDNCPIWALVFSLPIDVTRGGMALFDIVPTVTDLFR